MMMWKFCNMIGKYEAKKSHSPFHKMQFTEKTFIIATSLRDILIDNFALAGSTKYSVLPASCNYHVDSYFSIRHIGRVVSSLFWL